MTGISVIIAAHDEAAVIEQTLRTLLASRLDRPMQLIVVANGCKDDTAARARAFGSRVEVIETPTGNKVHALNLGDRAAKFFPRAYLDADIELTDNALQRVVETFESDPACRLAAPVAKHVYKGRNPFLAGYYRLWRSMPYVRKAIMGSGFYAIDQTLRSRFGEFPKITADDKFVRNLARPEERRVVEGCSATVSMPETFRALLKVKTRWSYGNLELAATHPELNANDRDQHEGALKFLALRPWLWVHVPAFVFVFAYAKRAARKRWAAKQSIWERDDSTRPAPADPPAGSAVATHHTRPAA